MARSVRVNLKKFAESSENRRILKKFGEELVRQETPINHFTADSEFENFCLQYFKKRHGPSVMPRERLRHILEKESVTHIVSYLKDGKILGYVFLVRDTECLHFWFSFYDLYLVRQSLGMYLMLDAVRAGKKDGLKYVYLGTAYGEKGLYKLNFPGLEFWDGERWNPDTKVLKNLCKSDDRRVLNQNDLWKEELPFFQADV